MFVSGRRPRREVLRVKLEGPDDVFELWLIEPVLLGKATRYAKKAVTEDGAVFRTLDLAAAHYLEKLDHPLAKVPGLTEEIGVAHTRGEFIRYTVKQLIAAGVWDKFVKRRKIKSKGVKIDHTYDLTKEEIDDLKLFER